MLVRFRCLGSAARWTGAVVFERDEDEWQILHVRFGSKALGVGDFRSPIGLPSTCLFKALIEQLPHDSAAVGITFFFHEKLKAGQD